MLHLRDLKKKVTDLVFEEILSQERMKSFFSAGEETIRVTMGDENGYSYL